MEIFQFFGIQHLTLLPITYTMAYIDPSFANLCQYLYNQG